MIPRLIINHHLYFIISSFFNINNRWFTMKLDNIYLKKEMETLDNINKHTYTLFS